MQWGSTQSTFIINQNFNAIIIYFSLLPPSERKRRRDGPPGRTARVENERCCSFFSHFDLAQLQHLRRALAARSTSHLLIQSKTVRGVGSVGVFCTRKIEAKDEISAINYASEDLRGQPKRKIHSTTRYHWTEPFFHALAFCFAVFFEFSYFNASFSDTNRSRLPE